jgi:hypothetical protein
MDDTPGMAPAPLPDTYLEPVDPRTLAAAAIGQSHVRTQALPPVPLPAAPQGSGIGDAVDAFTSAFVTDSWIAQVIQMGGAQAENEPIDPNFNAYRWLRENTDADTYQKITPLITAGHFEHAYTERGTAQMRDKLLAEMSEREQIDKSGVGGFAGSVAAIALDPLTYVGTGWALRGATAGARISRLTLQGGLSSGAQEALLHAMQDLRSLQESVVNTSLGAVGAGGVGGLIEGFRKSSPHIANGLTATADRLEQLAARGQSPSPVDAMLRDAGAAATEYGPVNLSAPAPVKATADGIGGAIATGFDKVLGRWTPIYQMLNATADSARNIAIRLAEVGPTMLMDRAGNLVAAPVSANALRDMHIARWLEEPMQLIEADLIALNRQMGDMGGRKVATPDFHDTMARWLDGRMDHEVSGAFRDKLVGAYGEAGAKALIERTRVSAQRIHDVNTNQIEPSLVKSGFLRDVPRLETAEGKLATLRAQRDDEIAKLREQAAIAKGAADRGTQAAPEAAAAYAEVTARIAERQEFWRREIEPWAGVRETELAKPESLGKDYGYAQLYDRSAVLRHAPAFRDLLLLKFATEPYEGWLREVHGMSAEQFRALANTDPAKHREVMLAWTGDEHLVAIERATARLEAAEQRLDLAKADLHRVSYYADRAEKNLNSDASAVAAAERARRVAARDLARAEKAAVEAQQKALKEAAEAAREQTLSRQMAEALDRPDVGADELVAAMAAGKRAAAVRRKALEDPVTAALEREQPGKVDTAGDVGKAQARADKAGAAAFEDPLIAPPAPEGVQTQRMARLQGRIDELEKRLRKLDAEIEANAAKLSEIDEALDAFRAAVAGRKTARDAIADSLATANKTRKVAAKNVAELRRQLAAEQKRGALHDVVDDIVKNVMTDGSVPRGTVQIDPSDLGATGRLKERHIRYTPEEREALTAMGVLRQDLANILESSTRSLAGHLSIHEALGIGPQGAYKSWAEAVDVVQQEYRQRIADAATPKEKIALEAELKRVENHIALFRDRLTGADLSGVANKDSVFYWGTQKSKQLALLNYLPGFGIASLTDFAALLLNHRLGDTLRTGAALLRGQFKGLTKAQIGALARAAELTSHASMDLSAMRSETMTRGMGIGVQGSTRHTVTSNIDFVAARLQGAAAWVSGLPQMTNFLRQVAAIDTLNHISARVADFDALHVRDKGHLATLGIDKAKAERLHRYLSEHGTRGEGGMFEPNVDRWGTSADAQAAARDLDIAITRETMFATPSHGVGDVPRFLSTQFGSMLMQFQSFMFTAYSRLIAPMIQKATYTQDARMMGVLAAQLSLTMMVIAVRDTLAGKDPTARYAKEEMGQTMFDIVDRSGFLGWMTPYTSALLRASGMQGSTVSYQNSHWSGQILGAQYAQLRNIERTVNTARGVLEDEAEMADLAKAAARISPFGMYARLTTRLLTE